jgi:hypothetical protein
MSAPTPPTVHVRAVITWLAIFPLVALGMTAMAPVTADWHPVLRALVLTLIVVPQLMRAYGGLVRRRAARTPAATAPIGPTPAAATPTTVTPTTAAATEAQPPALQL